MPDDILLPPRPQRAMTIKNLVPSLPERGKIKIGVKGKMMKSRSGTEFQPPQKLDHFLVTTLDRGQDGNFLPDADFHSKHGEAPTSISIRLIYDDPALNFPTRYACYIGRTLWCSGDGEYATRISDAPNKPADPAPAQVQCPCFRQAPGYAGKDKCKMNGSLSALIDGAGGIGGVWKFRTTSYNSIVGIMSSMAFLRSVTGGPLAGLPLKLTIRPKQAQNPADGSAVTIYVVNLEFDGDMPLLQSAAHKVAFDRAKTHVSIANIEAEARRVLMIEGPSNAVLPGDETDDVVEEFYPEQISEPQPIAEAPPHDLETGEVIEEAPGTDALLAAGDDAADGGTDSFVAWWNSAPVKPHRSDIRHRLEGWRVLAQAADARGGPAPEDEDPFGLPPLGATEPQGSRQASETPAPSDGPAEREHPHSAPRGAAMEQDPERAAVADPRSTKPEGSGSHSRPNPDDGSVLRGETNARRSAAADRHSGPPPLNAAAAARQETPGNAGEAGGSPAPDDDLRVPLPLDADLAYVARTLLALIEDQPTRRKSIALVNAPAINRLRTEAPELHDQVQAALDQRQGAML